MQGSAISCDKAVRKRATFSLLLCISEGVFVPHQYKEQNAMVYKQTNQPAHIDAAEAICYPKINYKEYIRAKYHVPKGKVTSIKQGAVIKERSAIAALFDNAKAEFEQLADDPTISSNTLHIKVTAVVSDLFTTLSDLMHTNILSTYTRTYLAAQEQLGITLTTPVIPPVAALCPWLPAWLEKTEARLLDDIAEAFIEEEQTGDIQKTVKSAGVLGLLALLLLLLSGCSDKSEEADEDAQYSAEIEALKDALVASGAEAYRIICDGDEKTCETCAAMAGKTFALEEFASGETAPPFHPNCRCSIEVDVLEENHQDENLEADEEHDNTQITEPISEDDIPPTAQGMTLSPNGLEMLANFELSSGVAKAWDIGEFDSAGNMIGIYPHYVFAEKNGAYVSDGGITLGYGYYVSEWTYQNNSEARALIDKYAHGAPILPQYVPSNGITYRVPESSYMPIAEARALYEATVPEYERAVREFLEKNSITLTQNQFDALVSFTYNYGSNWWNLDKVMPNFIREGNGVYDPDRVREVFAMHDNPARRAVEAEIFINGY